MTAVHSILHRQVSERRQRLVQPYSNSVDEPKQRHLLCKFAARHLCKTFSCFDLLASCLLVVVNHHCCVYYRQSGQRQCMIVMPMNTTHPMRKGHAIAREQKSFPCSATLSAATTSLRKHSCKELLPKLTTYSMLRKAVI